MPEVTYQRPWLYPKQHDAIFCEERIGTVEASTKCGKTAGCMIWLTEQALQGEVGQNFWWVAPIRDQAKIVYRRLKRGLPRGLYDANETELTLNIGGRVIWFKGADKPDSLYAEDVYAAVIDEASRCKEEAWHAVRTTVTATRGPVRIIGNVKGRKNWAYRLARRAESGESGMHYAKLTAYDAIDAGLLASDEIADAHRQLPEAVFRELYLAEPSEDGSNPFGFTAIETCLCAALSADPVVAWGWDLAKSHDWTVGVGLDADGYVAQIVRFQQPWEETIRDILHVTQEAALVDSTGVGDPVLERLQRLEPNRFEGFKFTGPSKQQLMEGLAVAIQQRQIRFPDGVLAQELRSFEYEHTRTGVRYTAPSGLFDDAVCALALAVRRWTARGPVMPDGVFEVGAEAHTDMAMDRIL